MCIRDSCCTSCSVLKWEKLNRTTPCSTVPRACLLYTSIDALCAPIGLAIGAQTAAEIALSILAQIVQVKNARPQTEGYPVALLDAMVQACLLYTSRCV